MGLLRSTGRTQWERWIGSGIKYLLAGNRLSPHIKSILGEDLHQKIYIWGRLGYWPQIREPRTFNEKILHRKLYTDNDIFSMVENKWRVREYVADRVGKSVLPEVYHVTDRPDDIPFDSLPEEYVIKPTHASATVIFVRKDETPDRDAIKQQCHKWLAQEHGSIKGEYWYSDIKPHIMVEECLHDSEYGVPLDFKLFVFHGEVEYIQVDFDRFSQHTRRFYDPEWNSQDFTTKYPLGPEIEEPAQLDEMIEIAETLGQDFDFIRIDLYQPDGSRVYFGEITPAHGSGGERFIPEEYDWKVGSLW